MPALRLLNIRLLQLSRELGQVSILHRLLFAGLAAALVVVAFHQYQQLTNALVFSGLLLASVVTLHLARPDRHFVFGQLLRPRLALFWEYLFLVLPFALPALLSPNWFCLPLVVAALPVITLLRNSGTRHNHLLARLPLLISAKDFEWLSGLRTAHVAFVLVYVLAFVFCWVPVLPLFLLWVLTLVVASFYQECEPLDILQASAETPGRLLKTKVFRHGRLLLLICLPVLALSTVFNPQLWWAHLLTPVFLLLLLVCAIVIKYSSYAPNQKHTANSLLVAFAASGVLVPFLLALPIAICLRFWGKARQRLTFYLHA